MRFKLLLLVCSLTLLGCKKDSSDNQWVKDEAKTIKVMNIELTGIGADPWGYRNGNVYFSFICDTCTAVYRLEASANLNQFSLDRFPRSLNSFSTYKNGHRLTASSNGLQRVSDSASSPVDGWMYSGMLQQDCQPTFFYNTVTEHTAKQWESFQFQFNDGASFTNQIVGNKRSKGFTSSIDGSTLYYACYDTIITGIKGVRNASGVYQDTLYPYRPDRVISVYAYDNLGQLKWMKGGLKVSGGSDLFFDDEPEVYEFNSGYYLYFDGRIKVYDRNWSLINTIIHPVTGSCQERIAGIHAFKNGLNIYSNVSVDPRHPSNFSIQLTGASNLKQMSPSNLYSDQPISYENGEILNKGYKWSNSGAKVYEVYDDMDPSTTVLAVHVLPSYGGYYMLIHDRGTEALHLVKSDERGRIDKTW